MQSYNNNSLRVKLFLFGIACVVVFFTAIQLITKPLDNYLCSGSNSCVDAGAPFMVFEYALVLSAVITAIFSTIGLVKICKLAIGDALLISFLAGLILVLTQILLTPLFNQVFPDHFDTFSNIVRVIQVGVSTLLSLIAYTELAVRFKLTKANYK